MKHSEETKQTATRDDAPRVADAPSPATPAPVNSSRRRFGKAGLAAPVIMTLASRPVWGSGTGKCSLSGDIMSGNVSRHDDYDCTTGYGCTPGFWKNNTAAWPAGYDPGECIKYFKGECTEFNTTPDNATTFQEVFGSPPTCGGDADSTLMWVLQTCNGTLDWHACGAVLNAANPGVIFGASVSDVVLAYQTALAEGNQMLLKDVFDNMNNRDCPLNAHGECDDGFTNVDGTADECVPVTNSDKKKK